MQAMDRSARRMLRWSLLLLLAALGLVWWTAHERPPENLPMPSAIWVYEGGEALCEET